jgi:hypothetical protein
MKVVERLLALTDAEDKGSKPEPEIVTRGGGETSSTDEGARDDATGGGFRTFAVAVKLLAESAVLIALMVTAFGEGGTPGAVYNPADVIVPTVELPPETSLTVHAT